MKNGGSDASVFMTVICERSDLSAVARRAKAEAIQLWRRETASWIASSQVLLAMTTGNSFAFPRRDAPEVCVILHPLESRGRRESRVRAAPAVSRAKCNIEDAHDHTGSAEAIRPSLHDGLRLTSCSPRRPGSFATVIRGSDFHELDTSVAVPGRDDFAVRF